jgi:predicted amidohydrolase
MAGSVAVRDGTTTSPLNAFCLVAPDGTLHRYDKIHPFTYAGEHERFGAGDRFVTVDVEGVQVTLFVCYDLRFADEFWATARDTDAYLVVANWPSTRRHHWRTLLDARAIENQAYVVGVNRVGTGGGLDYTGDSRIVDPLGEVVAGGAMRETILLADLDTEVVRTAGGPCRSCRTAAPADAARLPVPPFEGRLLVLGRPLEGIRAATTEVVVEEPAGSSPPRCRGSRAPASGR